MARTYRKVLEVFDPRLNDWRIVKAKYYATDEEADAEGRRLTRATKMKYRVAELLVVRTSEKYE